MMTGIHSVQNNVVPVLQEKKRLESTTGSKQARVQQIVFVNHKEKLYPEVTDKVDEKGATLNAVKRTVGGTLEMVRRQG